MEEERKVTGYPSIDKPWLKYYTTIYEPNDIPSPDCSMVEFLYQCNKDRLDNTALNYYGTRISFRKMFERIDRVAAALQACGVCKGDIVTLCALNTPEFVYLLYALNKVGAVSNWVGLTSPVDDLHEQMISTQSRIIFTVSLAYDQIEDAARNSNVEKIISVPIETSMPAHLKTVLSSKNRKINRKGIRWRDFIRCAHEKADNISIITDEMALIEYTGGSTGVPKGVMLSNKAMNSYYINFAKLNHSGITSYKRGDTFLFGVPLFLAFGASTCCHGALCHSLELIFAPDPSPKAGIKIIFRSKPNHIIAGRLLIEELVETAQKSNKNLSYIKSIMYGGEETNKTWEDSVAERLKKHNLRVPILNGYGMTETSAAILVAPDNETDGLIPFGNVVAMIVNPDNALQEYSYDTEGELCLAADTIMNGYFKNEKETAAVIFEKNGIRWLKTHDLALISHDGIIRITGRIKRIYSRLTQDKIQTRVYPMRIEEALQNNDLVRECAVVGVKDDILAYRSIAYVILSESTTDFDSVKKRLDDYCHTVLPDSHWPDEYIFIQKYPITRAGKIDYRALEEMAKEM